MLHRIDAAENVRRYLDVEVDLFDNWRLTRTWGRIGSQGAARSLIVAFESLAEAEAALSELRHAKEKRGYGEIAG